MNIIEMRNITMAFGSFKANNNITLKVEKNSVHAIIGENGAGKSTLMSVLFGLYKQTSGEIYINDALTIIDSPYSANKFGIGMVHQHFKLVDNFTVLQNIVLTSENTLLKTFVTYKEARKKVEALMKRYNFTLNLKKKVSNCTVAEQQKIEILRMLYRDSEILIFDEPTAVLSPSQIKEFLNAVKVLQSQGKTIIIISHKLEEIKEVAKTGTVIRKGELVDVIDIQNTSIEKISELMVGTKVVSPKHDSKSTKKYPILQVQDLSVNKKGKIGVKGLEKFNMVINSGEIVAIAGVEGSGQIELINAITGLQRVQKGTILLTHEINVKESINNSENKKRVSNIEKKTGKLKIKISKLLNQHSDKNIDEVNKLQLELSKYLKTLKISDITRSSIPKKYKLGMTHIPEDRQKHGLILDFNLTENGILQIHKKWPYSNLGILNMKEAKNFAQNIVNEFDVRSSLGIKSITRSLSGGNQQKFIVGREIKNSTQLIVIAQPTRGLDVGAISKIHQHILTARDQGKAILLVSYELDEILELADRVIVLSGGHQTAKFDSKNVTKQEIGKYMMSSIPPTINVVKNKPEPREKVGDA